LANGTSEARIVLVDDNGVRAMMTASWLRQMGWGEVAALTAGPTDADWVSGPHQPRVLGLERLTVPTIERAALRERLAAGGALVVDLDTSRRYAQGHIPGAWFAIRSQLAGALAKLPTAETILLTSPDGVSWRGLPRPRSPLPRARRLWCCRAVPRPGRAPGSLSKPAQPTWRAGRTT
jgi:rhodanese-related sulfurtransferase